MSLTDDPNDPRVRRGTQDETPVRQHDTYLVLKESERAKGFVRPYRDSYKHVGIPGPKYPLRDLNKEEERLFGMDYVKFEEYPQPNPDGGSSTGRFWNQASLDAVGKGCQAVTTMGRELSETYARKPEFYGSTYCTGCCMHRRVGKDGEFIWTLDGERVGA